MSTTLGPLIALAEDSAELRTLLASALERVGYRVLQVETGARLVEAVRESLADGVHVDAIVTDVRMPELGGLDAIRALRATGYAAPIIFMTAYGDAWTRARAAELGGVVLDKPLAIEVLRQTIRQVLGR